ncbi:O-linked N-acetylglucosamine transferase, SPINDLY family protein [Aphanothece hegewaldii CCALA 016]|uniref:O-linked N-acetylglucosamine transferase, SPINDLY family protein n=1 Tax=Aphanothece hegewaldii CCALA 016 TaxID=2107694 RepID=A0A2T1LZL7_9CHRO|nr:O-linked N-acetylglucosamine transferase, SPINDLY family protein [Aphanothece hegewaldii CCALA 016]
MTWHPQIYPLVIESDYKMVIQFYEEKIENEPDVLSHYWYLGLSYLLQDNYAEAQGTWFLVLSQAESEEINFWTQELVIVLETEAIRQEKLKNYQTSWLIRQNIQELESENINNLLSLILLEIQLEQFSGEQLEELGVIALLEQIPSQNVDSDLLLQVLTKILFFPSFEALSFAQASIIHLHQETFITTLSQIASTRAYDYGQGNYASELIKLCLSLNPENLELLNKLFWFNIIDENYTDALELAYQFYEKVNTPDLKLYANYKILFVLLNKGEWQNIDAIAQRHKILIQDLLNTNSIQLNPLMRETLLGLTMPLLYLQDNPLETRQLQNTVSNLFVQQFNNWINYSLPSFNHKTKTNVLKIGYIAHTLRRHSVGWLSRWLMKYHDKNKFQIHLYLINQIEDELTQNWFYTNAHKSYRMGRNPEIIANQIKADELDILIDLDSLTHNITSQVMCLRIAPIQVTWLGMDASGIPNIDYFIADPYVLPENAQNYYLEKIWRLNQTYLAIDGFEVGTPTLTREDLNIPNDAIIYLTVQSGLKRHPDTIRLQLEILKAVPNSYLLIKGMANQEIIQNLFKNLSKEIGVDSSKLRFLSQDKDEETHRANLQIADIVLDTYPYNGATTTLEVLWMGIPLVTKVGEQFAARNSYTFLKNALIDEGIAWTDEEYIQWGIKLGTDEKIRQEIRSKLQHSRTIAPLWNAQQFTRELEQAYQQMWTNYIHQ